MESLKYYTQPPKPYEIPTNCPFKKQWECPHNLPKGAKLALIGISDERFERLPFDSHSETPFQIRQSLTTLTFRHRYPILDFGDIKNGTTARDTIFALSEVVLILMKNNLIPVVFGGGEELICGLYNAIQFRKSKIKHTHIDFKIDNNPSDQLTANSLFSYVSQEFPLIYERTFLGTQGYYCREPDFKQLKATLQSKYRLGLLRHNIFDTEPLFRDSTFTTIDMDAVRTSDYPANNLSMPNGFYAEEICQLAWFAGQSNTSRLFGVFNYSSKNDPTARSSTLIAQILWHFFDGYYSRINDPIPTDKNENLFKLSYVNSNYLQKTFVIYKSMRTGRLWLKIENTVKKANKFLPISKTEYEDLTHDQISDKIFNYLSIFGK